MPKISQLIVSILIVSIPQIVQSAETFSPIQVGERLDFKVYFEFVLGGDASMSVKKIEKIDGHDCFHFVSEAHSTRTVDMFYKVRDKVESWQDIDEGVSRRYVKHLREGRHKDDKRVEYNPEEAGALVYKGENDGEPDTVKIEGNIQDVLSAFYDVRRYDLEIGKSVNISVHDIDKQYVLEVQVLRKETITVPAGEFECFVVEPLLMSSGIFRKEGNLQIWLTADEYKMPVLMRSKLYFGSVWAKLVGYRRGE
ncbi:DUF3108 domain-containing protein [Calditrichota bacterium]